MRWKHTKAMQAPHIVKPSKALGRRRFIENHSLASKNTFLVGKKAEDLFCRNLEELGWKILKRNFHVFGIELDVLACSPKNQLVVFEVKACDDLEFLDTRVSPRQRARLERAYSVLVDRHPGLLLQLGVVSQLSRVELFPDFFI